MINQLSRNKTTLFSLCLWLLVLGSVNVWAKHPVSDSEALQDVERFMRVLGRESGLLGHFRDNPILGNAIASIKYQPEGYSGFRGIFQMMGAVHPVNQGIFNFLQYYTDQAGGYIGLQNYNGSAKYKVMFSLWDAVKAAAGRNFECSTFSGEGVGFKCFSEDFDLKLNAIYYLDVELDGAHIRGYISEPQPNLDNMFSQEVERQLIGEIEFPKKHTNLIPRGYFNENWIDQRGCAKAYELTTFNCAPLQYHGDSIAETFLTDAYLYNSICPVENILVSLTADKQCTIYVTRPSGAEELYGKIYYNKH